MSHRLLVCCLSLTLVAIVAAGLPFAQAPAPASAAAPARTGPAAVSPSTIRSAIFLHPDGMGANTWTAARLRAVGPDGRLAWDRLPRVAVYVGPMLDRVHASSQGGATTHAYGVRAGIDSYGMVDGAVPTAASGKPMSLMREAQAAGKAVAVLNSASLTEPGSGAFLASVPDRDQHARIAAQILEAAPEIALGGGEQWFLPEGAPGRHGVGARRDGRNLIAEARAAGYAVVFTREELAALPPTAQRVLGLFASDNTFDGGAAGHFRAQAPRFDEMLAFALSRLRAAPQGYFIVGNEEATDDFAGDRDANGVIEAALGADRAIAIALDAAAADPGLTVIVASDSDTGGMHIVGSEDTPLTRLRAAADRDGERFLAAPDARGARLPFRIAWASSADGAGATVARGIGPGAARIEGTIDSTAIHRALSLGLFGRDPD
jgi:alkaline phosphatase